MNKYKYLFSFFFIILSSFSVYSELTIEQCVKKAQENYPMIKKYSLLSSTKEIELSEINKGWLPRIGMYAQLTGQNVVPSYPDALSEVLKQMGQTVEGLGRVQYKIGVDVTQTIWDGGISKARRELVSSQEDVKRAALDVELYSVRERVENLFFAILLIEEQVAQNEITYNLLLANLEKLRSMKLNGVAMQSDLEMVEAQALSLKQNILSARSSAGGYRKVLGIYMGEDIWEEKLRIPIASLPGKSENDRPELKLFNCKLLNNKYSDNLYNADLKPKVGFFAQAYYGYPGFDYFKSMMSRNLSFNILAGIKVSWNIDSFYSKKNNYRKTALNNEDIMADRELFLFNSRLQSASQLQSIEGIKEIMKEDERIIMLRRNVRKAAESQLQNGVIDATALLTKISDENLAVLSSKFHQIQYLQEVYKLKYILNQ